MSINFIIDFSRTCPDCNGHRFFKASGKCARCISRKAQREKEHFYTASIVPKSIPGTFDICDLWSDEFKNAERKMFAGVQYLNEPRIYD